MFFQRLTTEGLAHHSYFIASDGEAIVVDPRRDVEAYLALAREHEVTIRYVLETHRNEDFVIGSCELASRTDARVLHGQGLPFEYGEYVEDGQELAVGRLRLRAIATPGHTAESMSYALIDTDSSD
ncbi:MAG: MBL fold metallo-hydrolase, partial [Candidatus Sericytochromatia bacterium]